MKFLDLFSGIGGFRLGMEMAGHKCVGHCEIDKYANKSYIAMHKPKEDEWYAADITKVRANEIPRADCWCFGFPCQDISVAGKQRGLTGKRSGLFYTVIDLIKSLKEQDKPSYLFIENVKNLLSINDGWDYFQILSELDEGGYDAEWEVLNSKNFGVPQNRERVFIIGHLRGRSTRKVFPIGESSSIYSKRGQTEKNDNETALCLTAKAQSNWTGSFILKQLIPGSDAQRVYDSEGLARTLKAEGGGQGAKTGLYFVRAVLTPDRLNKRQNGRRMKEKGEPMFTLTAQDKHGVEIKGRIRRLTPLECFRLQGFPDEYFKNAQCVNSDTQLYRQAGNSVTVTVIYEIAKRMGVSNVNV